MGGEQAAEEAHSGDDNGEGWRKDKKKKPVLHAEDEFETLTETTFRNRPWSCDHGQPFFGCGEQPRMLIEIVFNHTKRYLGEKDAYGLSFHIVFAPASGYVAVANGRGRNEFGIPNVANKPCLLLYPYITMLALLFADQAFAAAFLTSLEKLFRLRIAPGQKQLPVPLKKEMAERHLFRPCKNTVKAYRFLRSKLWLTALCDPKRRLSEA